MRIGETRFQLGSTYGGNRYPVSLRKSDVLDIVLPGRGKDAAITLRRCRDGKVIVIDRRPDCIKAAPEMIRELFKNPHDLLADIIIMRLGKEVRKLTEKTVQDLRFFGFTIRQILEIKEILAEWGLALAKSWTGKEASQRPIPRWIGSFVGRGVGTAGELAHLLKIDQERYDPRWVSSTKRWLRIHGIKIE